MQYFIHKHMDYKNGGSQLKCFKCHGKFEDARLQYRNSSSCPLNPMSKKTQTGFWFVKIPWDFDGIHHWKSKFWRSFGIIKKHQKTQVWKNSKSSFSLRKWWKTTSGRQLWHFRIGTKNYCRFAFRQKLKSRTVAKI